jgi:lysophospholipase L1-like esterase
MDDATHNATYLFNNRYARLDFRGVVNRVILSIGKLTDIVRIRLVIFRFVAWSGGGYISSARVVSTSQWIAKANLVADADNDFSSLTWAWAACEHYHDIGDFLGIEINGESGAGSSSQALAIKTGLTAGWTDCSSATTLPDAGTVVSFTSAGQTGKQPKFTVYSNIPHIVMFGDSVAIGAAATYPYWTPFMNDSQRPDPAYQNPANNPAWWLASETGLDCATIGEGGTTVWTWLPANGSGRFSRLTDCTPKAAVCVVGINDIYAEATYGEGIETYMTRLFGTSGIFPTLIAAGTLCIMVSIPPISKTAGKPAPWDDSNNLAFEVRAWNNRLRKECRTLGVAYADFFNSVINPYTRIGYAAPYDFGDAVHLSTAGNKLMADSIVEAIRQSAS